jgi:hypothetical protein
MIVPASDGFVFFDVNGTIPIDCQNYAEFEAII